MDFKVIADWLSANYEWGVGLLGTLGGLYGGYQFVRTVMLSYRAIRLYHIDDPVGGVFPSIGELAGAVGWNVANVFKQKTLFKRVRMRLEFESLVERPEKDLGEPAMDQETGEAIESPSVTLNRAKATYRGELRAWKKARRELLGGGKSARREVIDIDNASNIHDRFDALDRLFDVLERLSRPTSEFRFATKVHIKDGFVAPLHLIAGVLREFDEDWARIINTYEYDHAQYADPPPPNHVLAPIKDLREIQKFIFDCWLQWGPSISLCGPGCGNFGGSWTSLQYGYGDENNSVELVGSKVTLERLWRAMTPAENVLAWRATVTGHIASSRFLPDEAVRSRIGGSLATSWRSNTSDGRLLVMMSERAADMSSDKEEQIANTIGDAEIGTFEKNNQAANYYSAYLWVIFTIVRERIDDSEREPIWLPTNHAKGNGRASAEPWLDFIPFFEHGNIADAETFWFLKRQLAEKAVAGIEKLVTDSEAYKSGNDAKDYPLRFALSSSLDWSGCGAPGMFSDHMKPESSIYELVRGRVAKSAIASAVVLLHEYDHVHPHASCTLPLTVQDYFGHVEDVARLGAKRAAKRVARDLEEAAGL